jgi:glycosyltransferase involved in cell wall biosynthesis
MSSAPRVALPSVASRPGVVVLVSYRPPPDLFRIQLQSIRDQTRGDFRCLIAADGDAHETRALVRRAVGSDDRFEVLGFSQNVGVYHNVERALGAVPTDVGWVALSDQDDRWYPKKLDRLVPLLEQAPLAMCQARVVAWPSGEVLRSCTTRRVVPAPDLVFENQVTGSFSVFRRNLLDVALPFPDLRTFTRFHDHWLGVCASAVGGYLLLPEVLQDYVQHGSNVVGERLTRPRRRPSDPIRSIRILADEYEGGHSIVQCARTHTMASYGWRRAMVKAAVARIEDPPPDLVEQASYLDPASGPVGLSRELLRALRSPNVSRGTLEAFVAGLPYELVLRLKAGSSA